MAAEEGRISSSCFRNIELDRSYKERAALPVRDRLKVIACENHRHGTTRQVVGSMNPSELHVKLADCVLRVTLVAQRVSVLEKSAYGKDLIYVVTTIA
jgi:hypothetical protein